MVFFTCDGCGESVKKNAVEKHYQFQCRNCTGLSCVDCGKNFPGDTYKEHIKCISEEEKYSGKDFKPKPNANKGEVKQTLWLEQVHSAIGKCNNSDFKLKSLLERLLDYPNIPRKKAKFENFIKNSMGVRDSSLTTRTWDVIAAEMNKARPENGQSDKSAAMNGASGESEKAPNSNEQQEEGGEVTDKKLSKRERKEIRRKEQHKEEKKSKKLKANHKDSKEEEKEEKATSPAPKKKKDKKRKHEENENGEEEIIPISKKKKNKADKEVLEESADVDEEAARDVKFSWEGCIIGVLKREDDHELSLKRLRKKVLAQYYAYGAEAKLKTETELFVKFTKKLKNPRLRTLKDRVKLLQ